MVKFAAEARGRAEVESQFQEMLAEKAFFL